MRQCLIVSAVFIIASVAGAKAPTCAQNFSVSGVPMMTAMTFKTFQEFPKLRTDVALNRLAQGVAAEGFRGIKVNKALNAIDAFQETSGSGRIQTLRVVARKRGTGTRVDAIFEIQAGQVTDNGVVRKGLCDIVQSAIE